MAARMTDRERYQARADDLLLRGAVRAAWLLLNLHADEHAACPACQSRVDRYEASRCTHARLCTRLHALAAQAPEPDDQAVDYTRVCPDCWQFPNRCDHLAPPQPATAAQYAIDNADAAMYDQDNDE